MCCQKATFPITVMSKVLWNQSKWSIWRALLVLLSLTFLTYERSVQLDWIINPFLLSEYETKLRICLQETLIEVCADRGLKLLFGSSNVTCFWSSVKKEHSDIRKGFRKLNSCIYLPLWNVFLLTERYQTKQRNKLLTWNKAWSLQ